MQIDLMAKSRSYEEFEEAFEAGDEDRVVGGVPILLSALANSVADRTRIARFLLEHGARADGRNNQGQTAFHVLFGQVGHDVPALAGLTEDLLTAGADPAAVDDKRISALQWIINLKASDDELSDLYDVWFAQPGLRFDDANRAGVSPRELAAKLPYRADLLERMERYDDRDS